MAEILKEWLTERLQRPIKWEAEAFGEMMKNGHIIASVLLSYNVINEEKHFLIRDSNAPEDIRNNWTYLSEWLRELEVHLNDNDLNSIKEGKGTALLRLFYQLFLHLDRRDRTNFIKRERKMASILVDKMKNRFKVEKVPDKDESFIDDLSRPLITEKQFIDWQRKKTEQVKETYDYIRHKYSKMLKRIEESKTPLQCEPHRAQQITNETKKEMLQFELRYPCETKNHSFEQLLELDKIAVERKKQIVDTEWAKEYMDNLHSRLRRRSDSKEFQKQVRNALSGSLWDLTVAEEEDKLDKELAKKVMKLSQFEKQMCTKLMETKQQARNLVQNRIQAEREFTDQREQQFNQFLENVKEQINLEVEEIDFEKKRQNMLHKKLYAEKMKRKRQHYYEICYETMLSIVDYATKYAYFKRLIGDDIIPNHYIHEWKSLYFKHQPIFDLLDPMENIFKEQGLEEEEAPEEVEIVRLELNRQEALNNLEFEEYHNYSYTWSLDKLIPNYDPESEESKYENLGKRILGHLVYTLLDIKYPYPPPRRPAALPKYSAKAVLRGLPDKSIAIAMQSLLKLRKIHVVRLESAINFCLKRFKIEMVGCTDIELSFDKMIATALEEKDKELLRLIKVEEELCSKNSEPTTQILGIIPPNCKQIQTPKTIPEEEIKLSTSAELGKYAYETLNFGDTLTDHLLSAMIVEYLKDQHDINGFVIINYPNTYREAQILEEMFTGCAPPDESLLDDRDDIYLEQSIAKHRKKDPDQYKEKRVSKLVDDPHKKRTEKTFETYFNCYIKLKETEDILQEVVIWDLTEDNSELIDRFYAILGINYSMYYEMIDKDFLAQICKYVIGDCLSPLKSYDRLFGENVLSLLDFPNTDDKRTKSKIVKPETADRKSKEKIRRFPKSSKVSINNELEVVKPIDSRESTLPDDCIIVAKEIENIHIESVTTLTSEVKILPGEEDWDYGEIPMAPTIGVALATCWEEIERTYISDIQQLFFAKRLQMNSLIPYARFIKDKMEQIMTLPSIKQDIVSRFQKDYNDFEDDWRFIHLTKNEWHCRVKELQNRLYIICDERKLHAEKQRRTLICENWAVEELTTMANTYISCMQTEMNRSILTFQTLHDFYFAMIKQMPPNDRNSSKDLTKIIRESDETSGSRRGGEDKVYRQLKASFQDLALKGIEIDYRNNPFNLIIENNVKLAVKTLKESNDHYRSLISREYSEVAKISPPIKRKDDVSEESVNIEEIFKLNALKCVDEWLVGINGEMYRANLRMLALQCKCFRDMKLFNDHIYKTFTEVQHDINTFYMNEIKSIDRLCKYLQIAIENGRKISESLILERDTFIIDPNLLQYAPPEPSSIIEEGKEMVMEFEFKVGQLAKLRNLFKTVAPTGIALQQAFIYMLQDFLFFGKESCNGPLVPEAWKRIDPEQIPKLVFLLYGETAYVDWRDFLIYCLNIRFPTVEELLDLRKKFRCNDFASTEHISRNDFISEKFWFEKDFDEADKYMQLRKHLTKHFIFELYETSENKTNFSAFLLAFCKNVDPIEGFVTALSMAVGKKICFSLDECEEVVCKLIKLKQYKDACLTCAIKCTKQFLEKVLAAVVNICEGTSVVELEYTEPPHDKTEKKGKGEKKAKKIEISQSARLPKSQKSLLSRNKMVQSETDVKKTFICRPCEGEQEAIKEMPKDKVVEEDTNEAQEDPNLAYVVSQATIWNVLRICLPGHFQLIPEDTPDVDQVKSVLKRLELDTDNGDIYVCKFVANPSICKLLHRVKKFTALNLAKELRKFCA